MTAQTQTKAILAGNIFDFALRMDVSSPRPDPFSTSDYGYPASENDLADDLSGALPANLMDQAAPQVDPEDFETIYQWFIS